jgi:hypothetical protein
MSELIDARQQEPVEAGFTEIIRLIGASRERAMQAVNTALIDLYWQIGETISRRVAAAQWGRAQWTNWPATLPDGNQASADSRAVTSSE